VPSRWLYPATLLLGCGAAAGYERLFARTARRRWVELVALIVVAIVAIDIGSVARLPLKDQFQYPGPHNEESMAPFHIEPRLPANLHYQGDGGFAPTTLSAERANIGTIECNLFSGLANFAGVTQVIPNWVFPTALGAKGVGDPQYRGEVFLASGSGSAVFSDWTPNEFEVTVSGAQVGDRVVVNQNWDPGWSVDGDPAVNYKSTIAAEVTSPEQTLRFSYRPPLLLLGCAMLIVSAGLGGYLMWRTRRARAAAA
jgi:hypothetical protein